MNNDYEILKNICLRRKSIRKYADQDISHETIQKIVDIAKSSPYASGQANWDILVIDNRDTIKVLADEVRQTSKEWVKDIRDDFREYFLQYTSNFSFFENAPVLIILTFRISPVMAHMFGNNIKNEIITWERDNYTKSISCAAMLVLLAAESLGLGACYMTGPIIAQDKLMKLINAKPGREIGALIPLGYNI